MQPDVTRMAGITEVLQVCETAHVVPPAGGAACGRHEPGARAPGATRTRPVAVLEYIPWIKDCFTEPAEVESGFFRLPREPGAGTTPTPEALRRFGKPTE